MSYTLSLVACGLPENSLPEAEQHMKGALDAQLGGPSQVLDACNAYWYSGDEKARQQWKAALHEAFQSLIAHWNAIGATAPAPGLPEDLDLRVTVGSASPFTAGHRSRLACMVIDCQTDDVFAAAAFWSAALGWPVAAPLEGSGHRYRELQTPASEIKVLVQAVEHPSRVHMDIETDDVDAEVARLESLGARRVKFVERWWVMESPTGQRFCVVRPQRPDFEEHANLWPRALAHPAGEI